jgi:4-hydroxybenzoate polyprenyltransferase
MVKTVSLWLATSLLLAADRSAISVRTAERCIAILAAVACWVLVSIWANDLADRAEDRAAGKQRWIQRLPLALGAALVLALAAAGAAVVLVSGASVAALGVYAGAVALGALYSLRPVRLKERGRLGLLAYSAAGAGAFAALPWAWLGGPWPLGALPAAAVLLDKWVNLHFHQVVDYEADRARGSGTYAVRVGPARARRTLRWAARAAGLVLVAVLAFAAARLLASREAVAAGAVVATAAGVYAWRRRGRGEEPSALVAELPPAYLGLTYATFRVVPLVLMCRLAFAAPVLWLPAGVLAATVLLESAQMVRYRYA